MVDMAMDVSKRRRKPKGTPQGGRFDREMDMADDLDLVQENETGGANPLPTVKGAPAVPHGTHVRQSEHLAIEH